uniref:Large ribosomal subunit protein eL30 n=1 Tax=Lygus hesperus TaxID=30085 RepID=A0A0A9Y7T0_LYGHE
MANKKGKRGSESINAKLALAMKSGKYTLGAKSTMKKLRNGLCQAVIMSSNCPSVLRAQIEYYSLLSKCIVYTHNGNNNDLGTACGRLFPISVLSIIDPGDSDIVDVLRQSM